VTILVENTTEARTGVHTALYTVSKESYLTKNMLGRLVRIYPAKRVTNSTLLHGVRQDALVGTEREGVKI
jgi:hypothetical protein